MKTHERVIFFDGICNLCNYSITLLLKLDKKKLFKYASLQGDFTKKTLADKRIDTDSSFVYLSDGKLYTEAEAVIQILKQLGGLYRVFAMTLSILPIRLLNFIYRLTANNRYRFFGKKSSCRLPTEEEAGLFLD